MKTLYILILLLLFGAGCQKDTSVVAGGGDITEKPIEQPIEKPIELKVNGVVLEKVQFDALKATLASKIKEDGVSITQEELRQITDAVRIQSEKCGKMEINGELNWSAIKKILELNCNL